LPYLGNRGPKLQLGDDTIVPVNDVKVLGVTLSFDLTMDKHVPTSARPDFIGCGNFDVFGSHWTRSRLQPSCTPSSRPASITVMHIVLLAGAPKATTDKLQRLLNAAARLLSGTKKFDRGLSQVVHVDLHWLDVPERVKYKLATMVYNCLHGKAPSYLTDCCTPISDVASGRHLRSASRRQLLVPRHNLSTYGRRAFSVAGPAAWNYLSDELREPLLTANSFRQLLKTRLFAEY